MNTETDESEASLLDPESTSFSGPATLMPCLFGESSSTIPGSTVSIAPSSGTRAASYRPPLSDRLTPWLISRGLVKGITHSSVRKQLGAAIRATVLWPLDGGDAG